MIEDAAIFEVGAQVLVIGNATVDETFEVEYLPQTGESLTGNFCLRDVGGKGANVATILARCGLATRLTTVVGNDDRGSFITNALSVEPLELDVAITADHCTDVSVIFSDQHGDNTIVTTVQTAQNLEHSKAMQAVSSLARQDVLVLQSNLSETLTVKVIEYANQAGIIVVFNPSPFAPWAKSVIQDVDIVFVNASECCQLTGMSGELAVEAILQQGPKQVVLTCGEADALLGSYKFAGEGAAIPVFEYAASVTTTACDTTGAGDTFLAVAVASACLRGSSLDKLALLHAAKAAAITIKSYGTRSAFPDVATLAEILGGS